MNKEIKHLKRQLKIMKRMLAGFQSDYNELSEKLKKLERKEIK